jgi:hypothetical protein
MRLVVLGLAATLLAGCYTYEPVALAPAPASGTPVRLSITDRATADLREYLGPNVESLTGRLLAADSARVALTVRSIMMHNGSEEFWTGDRITIPRIAVARVERRRFSASRTGFLTAISLAGAIVLADALGGGGNTQGALPTNPTPPGQ